jgi:predicted small metal-binding protein
MGLGEGLGEGETVTNRCMCGWEVTGPVDEVIDATIEHGRRIHNMEATRDDVLAVLRATAEAGARGSA